MWVYLFLSLYQTTLVSSVFACRSSDYFFWLAPIWYSSVQNWAAEILQVQVFLCLCSIGTFVCGVSLFFCNSMTEPGQKRFKNNLSLVLLVFCGTRFLVFVSHFRAGTLAQLPSAWCMASFPVFFIQLTVLMLKEMLYLEWIMHRLWSIF